MAWVSPSCPTNATPNGDISLRRSGADSVQRCWLPRVRVDSFPTALSSFATAAIALANAATSTSIATTFAYAATSTSIAAILTDATGSTTKSAWSWLPQDILGRIL